MTKSLYVIKKSIVQQDMSETSLEMKLNKTTQPSYFQKETDLDMNTRATLN